MSEWIEWGGGDCPVADETLVNVQLRDENKRDQTVVVAGDMRWSNLDFDGDIIAYRIVKPAYEASPAPSPYATIMRGFAAQHSCALACIMVNEMKGEIL